MTVLSQYSKPFKNRAFPFILDMLNDEMPQVCMFAIKALQKIPDITIPDHLVDLVLLSIKDSNLMVRKEGYDLISRVSFSKVGLSAIIETLQFNYLEKNQDTPLILSCLFRLGKNHSRYIKEDVPTYLGLDYRFLAVEKDFSDNLIYLGLIMGAEIDFLTLPKYTHAQIERVKHEYNYCI